MKIISKLLLATILAFPLSIASADECDYWHEMFGTNVPESSTEVLETADTNPYQGVDAYYQTYYYD